MTDDDKKEFDSTESAVTGKKDESGTGKAGGSAGSGGGIRLPPNKLKEVTSNWEYLDPTKVAARLAEFFEELPAKASANLQVEWANLKNKGFAIITQFLKYGQEVSRLMHNLTRENQEVLRIKYGLIVTGPSG